MDGLTAALCVLAAGSSLLLAWALFELRQSNRRFDRFTNEIHALNQLFDRTRGK